MAGKKDLVPDPTVIGEISAPPFVQLPDPGALFCQTGGAPAYSGFGQPAETLSGIHR